ncbi:MAG: hypothetical protein LBD15_01575 [Holosporales bacterium]|jgi:hypothetical protein|nr:hypothetical protein [Holosporales bacterium]
MSTITILKDSSWLHHADITKFSDITAFRMPGFPLLIALSKYLFGEDGWRGGVLLVHLLFVGISAYTLYLLARELRFKSWIRRIFLGCYITGMPLYYAMLVLTDSMFCSLSVVALSVLGVSYMRQRLSIAHGIVLFLSLVLLGFWRESGVPLILSCAPLWGIFFLQKQWHKGVVISALCLGALFVSHETMCRWNEYRTGVRFVTTGFSTALCAALGGLVQYVPDFWEYTCLKEHKHLAAKNEFSNICAMIERKMEVEEIGPLEAARQLKEDYIKSWMMFPIEQLKAQFLNTQSVGWGACSTLWPACGLVQAFRGKNDPLVPMREGFPLWFVAFSVITSCLLSVLMFVHLGTAFIKLLCKRREKALCIAANNKEQLLCWAFFLQSAAFIFVYLMIHMEYRYILSSITFFGFLGWWTLSDILYMRQKNSSTNGVTG